VGLDESGVESDGLLEIGDRGYGLVGRDEDLSVGEELEGGEVGSSLSVERRASLVNGRAWLSDEEAKVAGDLVDSVGDLLETFGAGFGGGEDIVRADVAQIDVQEVRSAGSGDGSVEIGFGTEAFSRLTGDEDAVIFSGSRRGGQDEAAGGAVGVAAAEQKPGRLREVDAQAFGNGVVEGLVAGAVFDVGDDDSVVTGEEGGAEVAAVEDQEDDDGDDDHQHRADSEPDRTERDTRATRLSGFE
jgi:hypothetical protein